MGDTNHVFKDLNALLRKVRSLAGDFAQGALARPEMIVNVAIATREGACVSDDAEKVWDAFDQTTGKKLTDVGAVGKKEGFGSDKARAVRISEVRTVIVAATKHDELAEWMNESRELVTKLKGEGRYHGNMQDAFIAIARAAKKSDTALTKEEIVAAICPDPKSKERTEKAELEKLLKAAKVVHDGTKGKPDEGVPPKEPFPSDELATAMALIEKRLSGFAKQ